MVHIASLSYGKDSCAMLEVIKRNNMPLDRIVHVEVMATESIPADYPEIMEFKRHADVIIKERYGITVDHIHAPKTYEQYFYTTHKKGKSPGAIFGFPMHKGSWCNDRLKVGPLEKYQKSFGEYVSYIGIAADEPLRISRLTGNKRSPLFEHNVTEKQAYEICEEIGLLSPVYTQSTRSGCWFCHEQRISQLRLLRKNYPDYWALLLKWDQDSPILFKPSHQTRGTSVHDFDRRFAWDDAQITIDDLLIQPKGETL